MENYLKTSYNLNDAYVVSVIDELPLWSAPFGLKLLDKINYRKNISAVDIGSGLGFPLLEVAMRLGNSCKVYGIDPWEAAVERAKKKIEIYGISNVKMISGFAEKIPLPDNSIDLIISNNGLNNVNNLRAVFEECGRISRTGAQLVFNFNTDKTMFEFYTVLENIFLEKNMQKEHDLLKRHIYIKRKPVEEFQILLENNGFTIIETLFDEFSITFVDGTTMLNHFLLKLAFIESWKEFIPEEKQVEIFGEVEKRQNKIAESKGSIKLTIPYILMNCEKTGV